MSPSAAPGPIGVDDLDAALAVVQRVCTQLEPNAVALGDAAGVFERLCAMQKLLAGAVCRMTPRYEDSLKGKPGVPDPTAESARRTGTSIGAARRRSRIARRAQQRRSLDDGLRDGKLSDDQASLIGDGDLPEDDIADLVRKAPGLARQELVDEVARRRAHHENEHERARRIHRNRRLRRWTSTDGAYNLHLTGPAAWGAEIQARLQPLVDDAWAAARRAGTPEPREAYEADALMTLITSGGHADVQGEPETRTTTETGAAPGTRTETGASAEPSTSTPDNAVADAGGHTDDTTSAEPGAAPNGDADAYTDVDPGAGEKQDDPEPASAPAPRVPRSQAVRPERKIIAVVDIDALNRGHCEGDETCEITGVGPVPVTAVQRLFAEAFLTVVFRDAVAIRSVVHLGRHVTAHQRTALEARGYRCAGCGTTHRLEIDHVTGWALTHTTTIDDLEWLCHHCHHHKTHNNWHWTGPPGHRRLVPPSQEPPTGRHPPPRGDPEPTSPPHTTRTPTQTSFFATAR